ncbi:hypothetical protein TNCV_958801 [Trichonephila clavipes]|nr:hypothetical protein TNCV_958801 [Trichonephila clavipes]
MAQEPILATLRQHECKEKYTKFFSINDQQHIQDCCDVNPNMETVTAKCFCILEYARVFSVLSVQRAVRNRYGKEEPSKKSILRWYHHFFPLMVLRIGISTFEDLVHSSGAVITS